MLSPVSALIDTSVWRLGEFMKPVKVPHSFTLGGHKQTVQILAMRRAGPYEAWKERQLEALPTIAKLARQGTVKLFNYADVPVVFARAPVERSRFQQVPMDEHADMRTFVRFGKIPWPKRPVTSNADKRALVGFCKWLLSLEVAQLKTRPTLMSRFSDFERRNLKSLDRFEEICRDLQENH